MQILKFPDPLLFHICDPVTVFGEELPIVLEAMYETMLVAHGIGLAANQVGLSFRAFVMQGPNQEKIFLVNPVILRKSQVSAKVREGCLSAPGEFLELAERAQWVEVSFQNEKGEVNKRVFKDLWSVCVQHEIGHLNGESFLESKSVNKVLRKELAKRWKLGKNKV